MPVVATPLVPKTPAGPLRVVALGRISTVHQDIENIEASHRYIQDYLGHIYRGPMQVTLLGEQASGMLTDRATIRQAEDLIARGEVDLMIAEDLARIYRNPVHTRHVRQAFDVRRVDVRYVPLTPHPALAGRREKHQIGVVWILGFWPHFHRCPDCLDGLPHFRPHCLDLWKACSRRNAPTTPSSSTRRLLTPSSSRPGSTPSTPISAPR